VMKFSTGHWVEVTVRRMEGPEVVLVGKVVEATPDYAVAECRTADGPRRFVMSEDTFGHVFFRRMNQTDWQRRKRR
jgi:hypothetical protein